MNDESLNEAMQVLKETMCGKRLCEERGFVREFRKAVIVVYLDDDENPNMRIYRIRDVLRWHKAAKKQLAYYEGDLKYTLVDAMHDTWPDNLKSL